MDKKKLLVQLGSKLGFETVRSQKVESIEEQNKSKKKK